MPEFGPPQRDPGDVDREELVLPDALDLTFEGFSEEGFSVLDRLKAHPHITRYREEKAHIDAYLKKPFKRYRDDLVVNWVLPNHLRFETEKNVFSRLLKNDFGAGGCHHHLWMAFYRPPRRRLTDFQLSHSLSPDGLSAGLYVGDYATDLLRHAKARIEAEPQRFHALLSDLAGRGPWVFRYYIGASGHRYEGGAAEPPTSLPEDLRRATGLWAGRLFPRAEVLAWEGGLVAHSLQAMLDVWPLYHFFAEGTAA